MRCLDKRNGDCCFPLYLHSIWWLLKDENGFPMLNVKENWFKAMRSHCQ